MRARVRWGAGGAICMLLALTGCTQAWRSAAIDGRVVDDGSGAPIAGAVVLVNWQIKGIEGYPQGQLGIFERITDDQGRFHIPAWGPKRPPLGTTVDASARVFKAGYEPQVIRRQREADASDVKFVRLRRFEGPAADYSSMMSAFLNPLTVNFGNVRCDWRSAPQLFSALVQLRGELDAAGVRSDLPLKSNWCAGDGH